MHPIGSIHLITASIWLEDINSIARLYVIALAHRRYELQIHIISEKYKLFILKLLLNKVSLAIIILVLKIHVLVAQLDRAMAF